MNILIGILVLLILTPIYLGWLLIVSVPIAILDIGFFNLPRYLFSKAEKKAKTFSDNLKNLMKYIKAHAQTISFPTKACACVTNMDGQFILFTEFSDGANNWSHKSSGINFEDASAKMNFKLFAHTHHPSCGPRKCLNYKNCPNRSLNSKYEEIIFLDNRDLP